MRFHGAVLYLLCALLITSADAHAATALRWKLAAGDQLDVQVAQTSKTETTVNNRTVKMSLHMVMEMKWLVESVDQEGTATISQMFTGVRIDMDAPSVGKVSFDTAQETKPGELTEGIAAAIGPLMKAKFSVQMSPRGEIIKVDIPKETIAAIKKASTTSKLRQLLSVEGITQLLQQSLAKLPEEAIDPDHKWSMKTTIASPLGQLNQTHNYVFSGMEQRGDKQVARIEVVTDLSLEPSEETAAKKLSIKSHKQSGSMFFDLEAGRFVATDIRQSMVSETPFRDLKIVVSVDTTSETRISPVEASADENSP